MKDKVVGFIGTGVMGKSMAGHIMQGGCKMLVYNRTRHKADELVERGAEWCAGVSALAARADVIITMVGFPEDVEEVYLGRSGLLEQARPGSYLVDMTTSTPSLARRIASLARERGLHALDAPVSGGDIGAREARLAIMAGGTEEDFEALKPIFELMGTNISLQGPAGSGQFTKMVNQIVIAGTMVGVAEAIAYAGRAGLDQEKVLKAIETGAAGSFSLSVLGLKMIRGDYAPGFYVKHFIKDMKIALQSAEELGLQTPGLAVARELYEKLAALGESDSGTQALYKLYR